jgi:hypothetical protein
MFTIISCSIKPQEAEALKKNVAETIGVPFEFIAYDNRNSRKGICQVYNECAAIAKYDNLCFIHEDVIFLTQNWGKIIENKLSEQCCGLIGFAGGTMKSRKLSGWLSTQKYGVRANYVQGDHESEIRHYVNPYNEDFSQVITLDGLCLFSSKKVWAQVLFDQNTFKKFHCYDVDYSLNCHVSGFKNYVCNTVLVHHTSLGSYDETWLMENEKFHNKWDRQLPQYVKKESALKRCYLEYRTEKEWSERMLKLGLTRGIKRRFLLYYCLLHPFNGRTYRYISKYLKYNRRG